MSNQEMIRECQEKLGQISDHEMQALWNNLCNGGFFLADTAKKEDLLHYSPERARTFLMGYMPDLLKFSSYVEEFWRFVVKNEVFTF